jgi:hypothetical protein
MHQNEPVALKEKDSIGLLEKFAAAPGGESFPSGLNGKVLV